MQGKAQGSYRQRDHRGDPREGGGGVQGAREDRQQGVERETCIHRSREQGDEVSIIQNQLLRQLS